MAQTPPPPPAFGSAEKRAIEWSVLTNNLEQRLSRLLPCDARVRSAIDETNQASEARVASLTAYWQAAAAAAREQTQAVRRLLTQWEAAAAGWKDDSADAGEESAALSERAALLADSARTTPALADAKTALDRMVQASRQSAEQAREREAAAERAVAALRDHGAANQARQAAVENVIKTVAEEGQRWRLYYAARAARGQTECSITQTAAPKPAPAIRPASKAASKAAPAKERR